MKTTLSRTTLLPAVLAAVLAACGGEGDAEARPGEAASPGPVYTSEVENVSRWIREGGGSADSAGLVAAPNPRGEGVLVYSRADSAAGGDGAAWVVVDSQVVPLNQASRRATPGLPAHEDERTWQRIGIRRTDGEAELRGVIPGPERQEPPAPKVGTPRLPAPDSSAPVPFPAPPRSVPAPRDTARIPGAPDPARREPPVGDTSRRPADTLRVPASPQPPRDTLRIPGPSAEEPAPVPDPTPATPPERALPVG